MLEFDAASAFGSDCLGGDPQKGLLGPPLARREFGSLVFRLPSVAALVSVREVQNFLKHSLPVPFRLWQSVAIALPSGLI